MRQVPHLYLTLFSFCVVSPVWASDFNLPFVNSAGLGVAYADWATAASDASTAYTNPAGLVKLSHQQIVGNALGIIGTARFTGSAVTPPFPFPFAVAQSGVAKSQIRAFMPSFYYSAPLTQRVSFGFNLTTPFGLGTNYGSTRSSIARYAATRAQVVGIDVGPSLGVKITDRFSLGAGFDALHLAFTLNNMYGPPVSLPFDSRLENNLSGWGYGGHGGILLDLSPETRIGLSYYSKISLTTRGHSTVHTPAVGPVVAIFRTNQQETSAALPARAQLSLQHDFTQRWTGFGTVFYTNWRTFNQITMENTETPTGETRSVTIPFNYHNCFDYAVGATFKATESILFRGGIQFMSTPSNDRDRGIADPVGSATIVAVGAHYQQNANLGYDVGVGHSFFNQMPVNLITPLTSLKGHTNTQTTAIGGQINWSFA
ncbi:outer membrane protein transport protein [Legionella anisa]|uniref:Aromatic hydrocarbon degradation protein n=1 Tax=Legionella anisa TaxID=28082 RepID=A0AAX0WY14_9GAMM|nr:outer membrane protein transport protein [Legionella anisa]AWN72513.1 aromatic hydrocarbon degradation protein [Legionella anisa]KTC74724.1 long-chain fatty acid transporter [Legionella anisa]MCW8423282.1 outer membrane protein transport protein [Legionella anisa]MCW8446801.1 outer membrane protein transport protein [Legionella anisa]PNL62965.1 aromatic hydrocarbon degradation protein [Legionella anisa]